MVSWHCNTVGSATNNFRHQKAVKKHACIFYRDEQTTLEIQHEIRLEALHNLLIQVIPITVNISNVHVL